MADIYTELDRKASDTRNFQRDSPERCANVRYKDLAIQSFNDVTWNRLISVPYPNRNIFGDNVVFAIRLSIPDTGRKEKTIIRFLAHLIPSTIISVVLFIYYFMAFAKGEKSHAVGC